MNYGQRRKKKKRQNLSFRRKMRMVYAFGSREEAKRNAPTLAWCCSMLMRGEMTSRKAQKLAMKDATFMLKKRRKR